MTQLRNFLLAGAAFGSVGALAVPTASHAEDQLLAGTITSSSGEKLGGVTVSAKKDGTTVTTSVYSDEIGNYYFPPLAAGKYRVWAQALSFETTKGGVDLAATKHQDLVLRPMTDQEKIIRQMPGEMLVDALPEDSEADARIKKLFTNQCTGCHTPGYILQFKFDEAGWNKIINLMKMVVGTGVIPENAKPNAIIEHSQKELAAYLARARGPGETSMKFKARPRPTGEAARAVFKEYDFPMEGGHAPSNDGSDWSLGTPSGLNHLNGVHDAQADLDGNIWF